MSHEASSACTLCRDASSAAPVIRDTKVVRGAMLARRRPYSCAMARRIRSISRTKSSDARTSPAAAHDARYRLWCGCSSAGSITSSSSGDLTHDEEDCESQGVQIIIDLDDDEEDDEAAATENGADEEGGTSDGREKAAGANGVIDLTDLDDENLARQLNKTMGSKQRGGAETIDLEALQVARKRRLELVEHFDLPQEPKKMCQLERPYSPFQPIAGVV